MKTDKSTWGLISETAATCKHKAEIDPYSNPETIYPQAFGRMTGVLTGLPDTPENRSFLQKWLDDNKTS